jgi:hypothetical protein
MITEGQFIKEAAHHIHESSNMWIRINATLEENGIDTTLANSYIIDKQIYVNMRIL